MTESTLCCSVCHSVASVVMFDIELCGSCFQMLSKALETRLTAEEMALFLRGNSMAKETRQIVSVVLSQLFSEALS